VFNGSLKSSSGLTAKSNIVEDGLMIQIPPEHMEKIRENLRNMKDHTVACGCINAATDETVNIVWGDSDVDFNSGFVLILLNKIKKINLSVNYRIFKYYIFRITWWLLTGVNLNLQCCQLQV